MSLLFVFLLTVSASLPAKEKKTLGEVSDAGPLLNIRTFCLDATKLSTSQSADARKFVAEQSEPKKVLGKLGWRAVDDCSQADAVIRLEFEEGMEVGQTSGGGTLQGAPTTSVPEAVYKTRLYVTDRASGRLLYRVEGESIRMRRENSIASPFSKLQRDFKTLSK